MKIHELRKTPTLVLLIFLIWITLMFLFNISVVMAEDQSDSLILTDTFGSANNFYLATNLTSLPYVSLITIGVANLTMDNIGYDVTQAVELPMNSTVVELPNNRIGIKSSNENFILLPEGSSIERSMKLTIFNNKSNVISVPEIGAVIGTTNPIIKLSTGTFVTNAKSTQSVDSLDKYNVKIVFSDLYNCNLSENIVCYSVDWGDGSEIATYAPTQTNIIHTYKRSATYTQKFCIKDGWGGTYNFTKDYTVNYEGNLLHTYFIVDEYKEPIAVTSTGIGGVALLGFALTETGKYKFLALLTLAFPMYTHIQKDDVLDQFVRGEIYGLIKTSPGARYNEIMKKLDVKNGTLSYHLHMLEKTEMIKSRREGLKYRAFYPTDTRFPKEERYRLTELQLDILKIITANEGITQKEIAKQLNKKPQTINYNVKTLQQSELIKVRKQGRRTGCYILKEFSNDQNEIP